MKTKSYSILMMKRKAILVLLSFSFFVFQTLAQTTFTSSGTYTVPVAVTTLKVECWGAGGGGSTRTTNGTQYGGGGGGGAYASSYVTVSPGSSYSVTVGQGGAASSAGSNSSFNSTSVVAAGGSGGVNNSSTAGAGGSLAASTGTIEYAGGNGGTGGLGSLSGAGGGAAGSTGTGGNASGGTAGVGTTTNGGNGADGISPGNDGSNGNVYGGGASGGATNSTTNRNGGVGANGLVIVTPYIPVQVEATGGTLLYYYLSLKAAFDAINVGTHTGVITIKINNSVVETSTAVLYASGSGSANYSSIKIYPTSTGLSVTGSLTTPLVQLDGADYVTIDGRVNQAGSTDLTLSNTSTGSGARTVEFVNSAQNNYLQYCSINGAGTSASQGTINFSSSVSGDGNDVNTVQYCTISGTSAINRPLNAIYSLGSAGIENTDNVIRYNSIMDFFNGNTASNGIHISSYSTAFSIIGNSFFETASFAPTASVDYTVIRIDNTSGNDFVVSDNFIGGSSDSCGGTAWTKTNTFNNTFTGIYLNTGSTNNSIQDNTIQNFSYANSGAAFWNGIYVAGGSVNIGTSTGNTIGSGTGTGSIQFTAGATGASFNGIYINSTGAVTCSKNIIGSITTATNNAAHANHFYGIYKSSGTGSTTISNNTIGSINTSNSINASSAATANSQILYGIYSLGTGTNIFSENAVSNLTNSSTETSLASRTRGIFINAGSNTIDKNLVSKLKTAAVSNGTNYDNAAIIGIALISTTANQTVTANEVNNLETTATGKIEMYGIYYNGPSSGTNTILRNFVHTFIIPSGGSSGSYLHGISLYAGNYTTANNIVYLGSNIAVGCSIWGIWTNSTNAIKIYHNTVYVAGTATSGSSNSYAFRSLNCPSSADIRNNILWDARTNSGGGVTHYAIYLNCTTNLILDYNDYQYTLGFGAVGGTTYSNFSAWKAAFNVSPNFNEAHSLNVDPQVVNLGGVLPVDYQVNTQLQGVTIADVTDDYEYINRVAPTMGAWEFFGNPVEVWQNGVYQNAYQTLKLAFQPINAGTYTGNLKIIFRGNTTETSSAVLNASGTGSASYSRILVIPGRSGITVTGNLNEPLVSINGADNVTFDGRVNGVGSPFGFTFINTSTSAVSGTSTFQFVNSAESDTLRYCNIKGAETAAIGGVIYFGSASFGNGNDGIVITNNTIRSVNDANRPQNVIYSQGSVSYENSGIKILNNTIFDFFRHNEASFGVNVGLNSTNITVSGNSFYETTNFTPTAGVNYNVIYFNNTSGNGNIISENYIGGNAASCAGTWSKATGYGNLFRGISLNVGTTTASSIQGNVIKNINWNNTGAISWYGIDIVAGYVNVGTSSGNIIGATTGVGSITLTNTASGGNFLGIIIGSSGTVDCQNNKIGSIATSNASTNATHFYGIYKSAVAGTTTISKNLIGSITTANSVNANSISSANPQYVFGISSAGTENITLNENVIANLKNATTNSTVGTSGRINGLVVSDGSSNTVTYNTISNLSIDNANTSSISSASVIGIVLTGTNPTRTILGNTIYNLSNTFTNYAGSVYGLYYEGSTSGTNTVSKNFIHSLTTPNNSTTNSTNITGIRIVSGSTTYDNNIINLGTAGVTNRNQIYGIYDTGAAAQTCNLYFNSVYLAGTESGNNVSSAIYSNANSNTRNFRNNVLFNARTSGSGVHYAIYYNYSSAGSITADYNDYFCTGTTSFLARYNAGNDNTIPFIAGQDANSVNYNPLFNVAGSTTSDDYKVATTLNGITGTGITTDFGLNGRPGSSPTMGAWESNANKWKGTNTDDWNTASNWTGNIVPAVDANIEFDPVPLRHCVMDQARSVNSIINAQSTYRVVTNGRKLTVKGSLIFTNGAQIDATSTSSIVEFAGSSAQTIPAGSFYNNGIYDLTINNANNVNLYGTLKLLHTLTATSGRLDAFANSPAFWFSGAESQSIEDARFLNNKVYDLTIDNAPGVNLNTDFSVTNNLIINSGKLLNISVANQMLVQGTVTNNAGVTGLWIKSSSTAPTGSFVFFNSSANPVAATVEMYTKSFYDPNGPTGYKYKWQYFGIPTQKLVLDPYFSGSYVRRWEESGTTISNHWVQLANLDTVYAFKGYEITQLNPKTLYFSGNLINTNYSSGKLPYTPTALYPGQNILANPHTTAIDIKQLSFGSEMEKTVYLYNSGSYNDWVVTGGETSSGSSPGQYIAIPINLAGILGLPSQIPSMSSYLVKAFSDSNNATLSYSYASAVTKNAEMQRTRRNTSTDSNENVLPSTMINVKSASKSDVMWIFTKSGCTHNFDNGWDGYKNLRSGVPQIYSSELDGNYQANTVDDIDNSVIGFFPGVDSVYTMSFTHLNSENVYPNIYLVDTKNNSVIDITETGTEYTFKSFSGDALIDRFKIVTSLPGGGTISQTESISNRATLSIYSSGAKVYVQNNTDEVGNLSIYDLSGRFIDQQEFIPAGLTIISYNLSPGVYYVKGVSSGKEKIVSLILK